MATSRVVPSLLVRIDTRARGRLQQQIYGRHPPGDPRRRGRPRGAPAVVPRAGRRSRRIAHDDAARARAAPGRGLSHRRGAARAPPWPRSCPTTSSAPGRRRRRRRAIGIPPLSRRGSAARGGARRAARRLDGPPRAFRLGTPAVDLFPVELWSQLASRRLRAVTAAQLDYGDAAGLLRLREAIADHVQAARGTRCEADQVVVVAGAQQGFELVCRAAAGSRATRPGWRSRAIPARGARSWAAGARIVPVRVDAEGLDVERAPAAPPTRASST